MFLSNKSSIETDGVGDLYRSAEKIAKGNVKMGMTFFEMAKEKIGDLIKIEIDRKKVSKNNLYWAEKVLDEYMRVKRLV